MEPYRIERTRNRHSRALLHEDVIVIRLARNLSAREEQHHVENLLRRMTKVALRDRSRPRIDPFRPLLDGQDALLLELCLELCAGMTVHFQLLPGKATRAKRIIGGWSVTVGPRMDRKALHRFLWKLLSVALIQDASRLVDEINMRTLRVRTRSIRLRRMSTQWGSCSHRGDICLNTALFVLPRPLLEYVIIHELAHCVYRSHGPRFWALVERYCPDVDRIRKELRTQRVSGA